MATEPATHKVMTAEELLALPDDDRRRELIEGELREMIPPGGDHGSVAVEIGALIRDYAKEHAGRPFGEAGFKIGSNPDTVRAPDAAYVRADRAQAVGSSPGYWPGAPDLAAEVVSPNDTYSEVHEKALAWLEAGTGVVLVADPAAGHVTRYRSAADVAVFAGDEPIDCAPAMPGFAPVAAELLAIRS